MQFCINSLVHGMHRYRSIYITTSLIVRTADCHKKPAQRLLSIKINLQEWCGITRPESTVNSLLSDPHSPDQYRVNIVLGNFPQFLEAFNCPKSSGMYQKTQCRVWQDDTIFFIDASVIQSGLVQFFDIYIHSIHTCIHTHTHT